jgi:hypothetical protein
MQGARTRSVESPSGCHRIGTLTATALDGLTPTIRIAQFFAHNMSFLLKIISQESQISKSPPNT